MQDQKALALAYHHLDLPVGASMEEVQSAFKRLSRLLHPEMNSDAKGFLYFLINISYLKVMDHLTEQEGNPDYADQERADLRPYAFRDFSPGSKNYQGNGRRLEDH
jgi:curved DNA-binding protein CbpA